MMMSYQNSPSSDKDDDDTTLLVVTTITTPTTTTSSHRLKRMDIVAIVAGVVMLVAGGVVWMQDIGSSSYNPSSGSFTTVDGDLTSVDAEHDDVDDCTPAGGHGQDAFFKGTSVTTTFGKDNPFQSCYQNGDEEREYCWSNSTPRSICNQYGCNTKWYECHPKPKHGPWDSVDLKDVVPYKTCGPPCDKMYYGASF